MKTRGFGASRIRRAAGPTRVQDAARFTAIAASLVVISACGARSSLLGERAEGAGTGGAASSGSGPETTSSGGHVDSCHLPSGVTVLAPIPPDAYVQRLRVGAGVVTLTAEWTDVEGNETRQLQQIPACGGELVPITPIGTSYYDEYHGDESGLYYEFFNQEPAAPPSGLRHRGTDGSDTLVTDSEFHARGFSVVDGDIYLLDVMTGAAVRVTPEGYILSLASAGELTRTSNLVVAGDRVRWIGGLHDVVGPMFSASRDGGDYVEGPVVPVPYDIAAVGDDLIAAYASDDASDPEFGNIERIAPDGTSTVLATGQFEPSGLTVVRDHAVWEADGVVRAVPLAGGDVIDVWGTPYGDTDPGFLGDELAIDDDAIYRVDGDGLIRVPLPF